VLLHCCYIPADRAGTTQVVEWQHPRFRGYGPFASAQGDGPLRPSRAEPEARARGHMTCAYSA